ncbi:unnamed protein product [Brassicogethes aeneus]|uniref:MTP large subunit lipid-binding domain-containing protein n=1 Tax=Brassicogethes aeneus TaxID=1431903 RepID=A0A9P0BEM2_BRAAE|nr:unnamed protein product [Brassicogethes aeneus]
MDMLMKKKVILYKGQISTIECENIEEALEKLIFLDSIVYTQESLLNDREMDGQDATCFNLVNEFRDNLKSKAIVTLQLHDILGFIQSQDSHEAVIKNLIFDDEKMLGFSQRYLWDLSICFKPNPDIIMDLLKRFQKNNNIPEKVKETMILSIASIAYRLSQLNGYKVKVLKDVEEAIINNLDYAKGEEKYQFFRALKILKSPNTIPKLLDVIEKGTPKEGVLSWKIIKSLPKEYWGENVLKAAKKTFFQLNKRHDSSSRTIAAELMLETNITEQNLKDMFHYLGSNDTSFEIKQYVYQNIRMKADECQLFRRMVLNIISSDPFLNNYSTLAPRGMSTALSRNFLSSDSSNGSLVSLQELKSGIVKRGSVNIVMKKNDAIKEIFSLGLFSGGLSSFMSSNGNENDLEDEESANAGMELSVLGTQLRPFLFFSGQGEIMGHVWSGTASEKTPAYQVSK